MTLAYDIPYQNEIRNELKKTGHFNRTEPDIYGNKGILRGGSKFKLESNWLVPEVYKGKQMYLSGNGPNWNYYNRNVLDAVNKGNPLLFKGGAFFSPDPMPSKIIKPVLMSKLNVSSKPIKGGKLSGGLSAKENKFAVQVIKKLQSKRGGTNAITNAVEDMFTKYLKQAGFQSLRSVVLAVEDLTGVNLGPLLEDMLGQVPADGGNLLKKVKKTVKRKYKEAKPVLDKLQPIAKKGVSKALDLGIPAATGALAGLATTAIGAPGLGAPAGIVTGVMAREGLKQLTGLGVGQYKGGAFNLERKIAKEIVAKVKKMKGGGGIEDNRSDIQKILDKYSTKGSFFVLKAIGYYIRLMDEELGDQFLRNIDSWEGSGRKSTVKQKAIKRNVKKPVPTSIKGGAKKSNPWVAHVKKYAKDNNMNYSKALKCGGCKDTYKK